MVQLGSRLPFAQAAELMGRFWKVEVSEATVRRATEKSGQAYVEVQREEVAALEQEMQEAPLGPALQQLSVDGAMVPLLHGEWGEVKTLAIGTIEQSGPEREAHARDMSYFSRMLDHGRFGWLATVETHRRGTGNAGTVCAVVDGAEWQQKFIDLHCPEAVRILDWCHAAEYLARAGQAAFGSGTREASEWLGRQLHELKHGGPERLLENLGELGLGLGAGGALKTVKASVEYLEKRRGQIRYAQFQAAGYPIGSGAVESANKLVVEQRLKGPGMHWARANVNPMVALRTVICSGRWEEAWSQISRKLGQQAKKRRMKQDPAEVPAQKGRPTATDANKPSEAAVPSTKKRPATPPQLQRNTQRRSQPAEVGGLPAQVRQPPTANHPWRRMTIGRKPRAPKLTQKPYAKI